MFNFNQKGSIRKTEGKNIRHLWGFGDRDKEGEEESGFGRDYRDGDDPE